MTSSWRSRKLVRWSLALCWVFVPALVSAQEEAPVEDVGNRIGNVYFSFGTWVSQPVGTQYSPAGLAGTGVNTAGPVSSLTNLDIGHGTEAAPTYEIEYELPSNYGTLSYSVYKQEDIASLNLLSPSEYIYQQSLSFDFLAGFRNDGLADGFLSVAETRLRERNFQYSRQAFETPRVSGIWSVGWRRVEHRRELSAEYLSLITGLPPFLPPLCTDCEGLSAALTPRSDTATTSSKTDSRGIEVGFDLEFPLWKNKIVLEGGVSVSALRGDASASYSSTNYYYTFKGELLCGVPESCDADYGDFNLITPSSSPSQLAATISATLDGVSQSSLAIDTRIGFRWRTPLRRVEVFGGFKQSYYDDAVIEIRPEVSVSGQADFRVDGIVRQSKSVTYEGIFAGVRLRLY